MGTDPKPATEFTRASNAPVELPFDDADFERASRGLVAQIDDGRIAMPGGHVVWDMSKYDFIQRDAPNPDTVDPSLWRQSQLNAIHGLFEVGEGIWQARGYDISNITFIEGATGWVIIDPLTVEP
ncbi:MAG: MBL fold metallo-hydrolase, partial [Acidimicrobiia bacterium]|nr:MBL fold metallo-hydrolase [Acidimicrobiia bacterium]